MRLPTHFILRWPPPTKGVGTPRHEFLKNITDGSPRLFANVVARQEENVES